MKNFLKEMIDLIILGGPILFVLGYSVFCAILILSI